LLRKTVTSLKRSTLQSLIGGDDPVLPKGSYVHNLAEGKITLNSGGVIYLMGMDDPVRIRSINAGCIAIDEAIEFSEAEYLEVLGRLRGKEGSRQIFLATNPGLPSHFLYKRFFTEKNRDREVVCAKTAENTHLPQDYINSLNELPEVLRRRYVEGEWCAVEGCIYDGFNRDIHIKTLINIGYEEYILGLDMGYSHPAAILLAGRSGDRLYIIQEWRKSKQLIDAIINQVADMSRNLPSQPKIVCDPSAATMIAQLEAEGFNVQKANNDVLGGINRVRQRLVVRSDQPDLIINSNCMGLVEEFENYQFEQGTEKPIKVGDDLIDCLRYIVNAVDDQKCQYERPMIITGADDDDEGWG
jgi:PBSX family phage terminase large subunit